MKIKQREHEGLPILTLKGKIMGGSDADSFRDALLGLIEGGNKMIIIDLGGVTYMSSTGLGILVSGLTTVKRSEGDICLVNVGQKMESLLTITQLIKLFKTAENLDGAVKALSG